MVKLTVTSCYDTRSLGVRVRVRTHSIVVYRYYSADSTV